LEACEHKAIYKEDIYGAVLVDQSKCMGDRNCFEACPYGTPQFLSDDKEEKMLKCDMCIERLKEGNSPLCVLSCSLRALDFGPLDELREKYGDTGSYVGENEPPCHNACPGGLDIQRYMNLTSEGKYEEALDTILDVTPFAGILGRVCTHACEIDCFRGRFDDAIAIKETKRFLADYNAKNFNIYKKITTIAKNGKTVAIVGGGPSGLSCSYRLVRLGYDVTIFEQEAKMGGKMYYGIPEYRLPREVLDREIGAIRDLGVKMKNGWRLKDFSELNAFDAVYLATGAGEGIPLNVPGSDSSGIITAVDFLYNVNTGRTVSLDRVVVVVGGGNVAIDAARTAVRLGASKVHIVCLESADYRDKEPMPALEEEVRQAVEEGIIVHDKYGVHSFQSKDGAVTGLSLIECLSVMDDTGRFSPCYACGDPILQISAELILLAIGQRTPASAYPAGTPRDERGRVEHAGNFQTKNPRIFAGGDMLTGMVDIISAVAAGNEGAISIHRFLEGSDIATARRVIPKSARPRLEKKSEAPACRPAKERRYDFKETTLGFDQTTCSEQSERCLHCGSMIPSVLIRRETPKRNILPWDKREALALWSKRCSENGEKLPDVIDDIEDVLDPSEPPIFFRGKLRLKARTSEEKLLNTMDDE
jgi:NADPH-dependent glutamate synthase beta subunit-like oxidoreductase